MKNLPEKIYFNRQAAKRSIEFCSIQNIRNGSGNVDVVEYIRSDVAEQVAKEFAEFMVGGEYILWEDGALLGHNDDNTRFLVDIDELFDEFLNGRKAQK